MPCPFCGGNAEIDTAQGYRNFSTGKIETAIAVYCLGCGVTQTTCRGDVPDITAEMVIAAWNARPKINDAAPRFHIDHGVIHDRFTGKHVTTDEDSAFCDGIVAACALLNELNAGRQPFDDERERKAAWKAGAECGISESDMFGWVNGWLAARSDEAER